MIGLTEALVVIAVILITHAFISVNKRPKDYPPGPFLLPIIGYLPFMNKKAPMQTFRKLANQFGEAFSLRLGTWDVVYFNTWSLGNEAFNNPDIQGRPHFFTLKFMKFGFMRGIGGSEGDLWLEHRRFTLRHLRDFGFGKLSFEFIILREVDKIKKVFKEMAGQPSEITALLNMAIVNIIWKMVADVELDVNDPSYLMLMENIERGTEIAASTAALDFLPWLKRFIPENMSGLATLRAVRDKLHGFSQKLIHEHQQSLEESTNRDYIDVFLKKMKEDKENKFDQSTFTELQLFGVMIELFVAGSESTATTLKFIFLVLISELDMQRKLRKEILSVTRGEREVSLTDKNDLPYTEAFIMEVQRVCNVVPLGIPHRVTATTRVGNYILPKDTLVTCNFRHIHKDSQSWPEPEKVDPTRFLDKDGKVNRKIEAFLPFSVGKRQCLGESLAKAELFLFLANLLQEFSFSPLSNVTPPSPQDAVGGILFHPPPFELIITPLKKSSL